MKSDVGVPFKTANSTSLPLWERGLKFCPSSSLLGALEVAPLVGAWIEMKLSL